MKKIILTLVAAVAITTAMAQTTTTKSSTSKSKKTVNQTEMVTKRTQEMVEKYGLSTEQATKLKTLNEKYMGKDCGNGQAPEKKEKTEVKKNKTTTTDGTTGATEQATSKTAKSSTKQKAKNGKKGGPDMTAYNKELKEILSDSQYKAYETEMSSKKCSKKEKKSE